jgi:hypothetical protein
MALLAGLVSGFGDTSKTAEDTLRIKGRSSLFRQVTVQFAAILTTTVKRYITGLGFRIDHLYTAMVPLA